MSGGAVVSYLGSSGAPVVVTPTTPLPVNALGPGGGPVQVVGNVASGATDSGNPVKVGGIYNAILPTFTTGQRADLQLDQRGNTRAKLVGLRSGGGDGASNTNTFYIQDQDSAGTAGGGPLNVNENVFNGLTWDRMRGSAAEGVVVKPFSFAAGTWQNTQSLTAIGTTAVIAAAGAGVRNYLTGLSLSWIGGIPHTVITILDGATVIARFNLDGGGAGVAGSNLIVNFATPLRSSTNTALNVAIDTVGPVAFNAQGYQAAA